MQPKQEGLTLSLIKPNEKGKIILPGAVRKEFLKPNNFEKLKKKYEATGKLDREDFNNAKELGQFLDWYNQINENRRKERNDNEILEISKFLARASGRKSFVFKRE